MTHDPQTTPDGYGEMVPPTVNLSTPDPRTDMIEWFRQRDAAIKASERARIAAWVDALEHLAFSWPAPNPYTPQVVQACVEMRHAMSAGASK